MPLFHFTRYGAFIVKTKRKPGPHEELHTLAPLTFGQALETLLKAKPPTRTQKPRRKRHKKKP